MTRDGSERPVTLVTGASSGIGRELATCFAEADDDLVLVARDEARLRAVADDLETAYGVAVRVEALDLTDRDAPETLVDRLDADGLVVGTLVNDAGVGVYGPFVETDGADELAMLDLNVVALTRLTKLLAPAMVARGEGRILNVASTVAFQPFAQLAVYAASKAYVLSFTEALAEECRGTGITVTALCPGPTETAFFDRADMTRSKVVASAMDPTTVARAGVDGLQAGEVVVVPGARNRLLVALGRVTPRGMLRRIGSRVVAER